MKTKLIFSILVLVNIEPLALASGAQTETNVRANNGRLLITTAEASPKINPPTGPAVLPNDPKQSLQDYDSTLMAITEKFTGTLSSIADAIKRGEITTDQGREISAEQYQIVQMQFQLVSLWREMEERDSATTPTVQEDPDFKQENEVVVVALPFSSPQLNPSVAEYLGLTPSQVDTIQRVMAREQQSVEPLMTQLRATQRKLIAVDNEPISESEMKSLADTEASALGKLIVANARMQSKIYRVLSPEQQKKLSDLERTRSVVTPDAK